LLVRLRNFVAAAVVLSVALPAAAEDHCVVKAVVGGKPVTLKHCAVAFYDSENSVTIFFTEAPLSAEEAKTFQMNAYPDEKDSSGHRRTATHLAFCPGGGKPTPAPGAVKSVEMGWSHASSVFLSRQWVFELPQDKELKIEKLSGDLKLGGRLSGRMTGGKKSDGLDYSWDFDFDLRLPDKAAAAGQGCGS